MNERKPKSLTKELVCKLTPEEKADIADQLTERIGRKDWLEDAKKVAAKKYAAQIEEVVAEINDLSNKIRAGEELRSVKCEIRYDDPLPGHKSTYRLDTGARIASELMSEDELQGELFPGEDEAAEAPEAEVAPEARPAAQLPLLSSADVRMDAKVEPEDVIAAAIDAATISGGEPAPEKAEAEAEEENEEEDAKPCGEPPIAKPEPRADNCYLCGKEADYHLPGCKGVCAACLKPDVEKRWAAIKAKIAEEHAAGRIVEYRTYYGYGCCERHADLTTFRFRFGKSWSNPLHVPGSIVLPDSPAQALEAVLLNTPGCKPEDVAK